MKEEFRKIPGLQHYWINKEGTVIREAYTIFGNYKNPAQNKRTFKEKNIKLSTSNNGYEYFLARPENKVQQVHVCVAKAFPEICGEWFEGCAVDHLNTIRTDNRAENLKVGTYKDNSNNPLTLTKLRKKGGLSDTKEYRRQYNHQYYLEHKEKIISRNKKWREDNRECYLELRHNNYLRNKNKSLQVL